MPRFRHRESNSSRPNNPASACLPAPIRRFEQLTGCPVLVNTSFNVRGEPIVCTPEDAFSCFMGTEIEFLAVGNCVLRKDKQNPDLAKDYKSAFDPAD